MTVSVLILAVVMCSLCETCYCVRTPVGLLFVSVCRQVPFSPRFVACITAGSERKTLLVAPLSREEAHRFTAEHPNTTTGSQNHRGHLIVGIGHLRTESPLPDTETAATGGQRPGWH